MSLIEKLLINGSTSCHNSVIISGLDVCVVLFCWELLDLPHCSTPEAKPLSLVYSQPTTVSLTRVESVDLDLPHCATVSHSSIYLIYNSTTNKIFCSHNPGCGSKMLGFQSKHKNYRMSIRWNSACVVVMGSGNKKLFTAFPLIILFP